jgi:hypothetical protein
VLIEIYWWRRAFPVVKSGLFGVCLAAANSEAILPMVPPIRSIVCGLNSGTDDTGCFIFAGAKSAKASKARPLTVGCCTASSRAPFTETLIVALAPREFGFSRLRSPIGPVIFLSIKNNCQAVLPEQFRRL